MNTEEKAIYIARGIFETGDELNDPVQRIEFMGGTYPNHETRIGGLSEVALSALIARLLNETMDKRGA